MKSKYGNVACNGYASKAEARRAEELHLLEKAGKITELRKQYRFKLLPKQDGERAVHYIADFVYLDEAGKLVVEDVKGVRTPLYKLKKKLMLYVFGIKIRESK